MGMYSGPPKHLYRAPSKPHQNGFIHAIEAPARVAGHLAQDAAGMAMGMPAGLVQTFHHPLGSLKTMAKSSWQDWSPLFHGHIRQWVHQTYEHPLAPLLDVAAVAGIVAAPFTAGASGVLDAADVGFRGASAAGKLGQAAKAGKLAYKDSQGVTIERTLRRAPLARVRQVAIHDLALKTEDHLPNWLTPTARADRIGAKDVMRRSGALHNQLGKQAAAYAEWDRKNSEEVAMHAQAATLVDAGKRLHGPEVRTNILHHNWDQINTFARSWAGPGIEKYKSGAAITPPKGYRFVRAEPGNLTTTSKTAADFPGELRAAHRRMLTKDGRYAAKDANGHYKVVPIHTVTTMMQEGANSATSLLRIANTPWKLIQVGWAPRSLVNNSVGNVAMTIAENSPKAFTMGVMDALRQWGDRKTYDAFISHGTAGLSKGIEHNFHDVMDAPSAFDNPLATVKEQTGLRKVARTGFYGLIHKQEQFLKLVTINAHLRGSAEVRALMKDGYGYTDAANAAMSKNRVLRDTAAKRAFDTMGDYRTFTKFEKHARDFMPFYSWNKHIVLHTASMFDEHPVKLALMGQMGQEGKDTVANIIGHVPSYMEGVVPLKMLGLGSGKVLSTRGLNPYASAGDLAKFVQGLTVGGSSQGGADIASGLSPFLTSPIERITGHKIGTDVPVSKSGALIPSTLMDVVNSVSEIKLGKTLIEGTQRPHPNSRTGKVTPFLYGKGPLSQAEGLLGVPIKDVNLTRAHELANKELGIRKKKKRKVHHGLF